MGRLHYTLREGQEGIYDGPLVDADYQHNDLGEPIIGDQFHHLGSSWRVVDWFWGDSFHARSNTLVVERVDG